MTRYRAILYVVCIVLFTKLVFLIPFFDSLEYKAQDTFFRYRGVQPISDKLAIVAIDDATFSALNETWPFPRSYHAKLIENLFLAGAKQVVFDVEFTESSGSQDDSILALTAARYGNVIFAGKVINPQREGEPVQKLTPIAEITDQGINWGIVNMPADNDGFIRKYSCYELFDKQPIFSIGLASLANLRVYQPDWDKQIKVGSHSLEFADKKVSTLANGKAIINYHGPARTFPYYSYASILDDSTFAMPGYQGVELDEFYDIQSSGAMKDKIVLIGATIDELHDNFPTPFGGAWMPGVEIHANFMEMILNSAYLHQSNPWIYLLCQVLLIALLWLIYRKLKPQLSAVIMLIFIVGQYFLAYLIFTRFGFIVPVAQTAVLVLAAYVVSILAHYLETMKEKRFIRSAFQQYMAPQLVKQLLDNPKKLKYGGSLQEITVLFSDIRSFTTYSESHTPEETVNILKEYLTEMVNVIIANQGILDKFVGDEVMALFGTPVPLPNHALNACRVALQMRERLTQMQAQWATEGRQPFEIGIGINTGQAVVGNLGSEQIFDYTAIGDTINLGARLEGINKEYDNPNHIIISEFTLEKVKDLVDVSYLDEVKVKGKNKAVKIYALLGLK